MRLATRGRMTPLASKPNSRSRSSRNLWRWLPGGRRAGFYSTPRSAQRAEPAARVSQPLPTPGRGEVRVRVLASGLEYTDTPRGVV